MKVGRFSVLCTVQLYLPEKNSRAIFDKIIKYYHAAMVGAVTKSRRLDYPDLAHDPEAF